MDTPQKKNGEKNGVLDKYLFLKDGYKQVKVIIDDIRYIQSDGNYLNVFTSTGKVNTRMTLGQMIEMLPFSSFVRVHNSYVINIEHIDRVENNQVHLSDAVVSIGPNYKVGFSRVIGNVS